MNANDNFIFDNDADIHEIIDFGFPRRHNVRSDHFHEMDELTFFRRFRLYKQTVLHLLAEIEGELEFPDDRNNCLSPLNQILCCLRFYASAGHLCSIADFMGVDVSTVSRIVAKVSTIIATLAPRYINMPRRNKIVEEQQRFFDIAQFPRVIGVVDGTHIKIQSPGHGDGEIYRNRKRFFSLNVQVIGSSDLKITNVVARWPGSAHDATIFANSTVRARFESGDFPNCFLLGDAGYPLKNYFLTPLQNPQTRGQINYNRSQIQTRNAIERLIGVWKRRFPMLAYGLRLKLDTVMAVIVPTAVLHNIARSMNEPEPPVPYDMNIDHLNYLIAQQHLPDVPQLNDNRQIHFMQTQLIENYFVDLN